MDTTRRLMLTGLGLGAAALSLPARAHDPARKLLVVYLRGGADALSLVPPYADDDYINARTRSRLSAPGPDDQAALELAPGFGLHPALPWLKSQHDAGNAAIVLATGAPSPSRSHFFMQAASERAEWGGLPQRAGWLARYLDATSAGHASPMRGVGVGNALPVALRGAAQALSLRALDDLAIPARSVDAEALDRALTDLFEGYDGAVGDGELERNAGIILAGMDQAARVNEQPHTIEATYPAGRFGDDLAIAARLIRQDGFSGSEVFTVDMSGWDTHDGALHRVDRLAGELNQGLQAFYTDLGARAGDVTTVVMSEFGRRIQENGSFGADHGSGGCMFVIGEQIKGGVYDDQWPGLRDSGKTDITGQGFRGDIQPMVDYRNVLADVLCGPLAMSPDLVPEVFPGLARESLGLSR